MQNQPPGPFCQLARQLQVTERMQIALYENAAVALLTAPGQVTSSIEGLRRSGFAASRLSVAGAACRNRREVAACYDRGGRPKCWADAGAFWGGLWETLDGWGFFAFPDIGPVLVAGPLSGWIVTVLENSSIFDGLSALGAALYSIGVAGDQIFRYEAALKSGKILLLAHGSADEVTRAGQILRSIPATIS